METAVQVLWWIGLVAALGLTAVVLKLVALVLRTLGDLKELAERIATAADGLASTLSASLGLEQATAEAARVRENAAGLAAAVVAVRTAVGAPAPSEEVEPEGTGGTSSPGGAGELGGAAGGPEESA